MKGLIHTSHLDLICNLNPLLYTREKKLSIKTVHVYDTVINMQISISNWPFLSTPSILVMPHTICSTRSKYQGPSLSLPPPPPKKKNPSPPLIFSDIFCAIYIKKRIENEKKRGPPTNKRGGGWRRVSGLDILTSCYKWYEALLKY